MLAVLTSLPCPRLAPCRFCYTCKDIAKEYQKYDQKPEKYIRTYNGVHRTNGKKFSVDVGYERFLGPELFFNPEIFDDEHPVPLPQLVDECIQACPIDCRCHRSLCSLPCASCCDARPAPSPHLRHEQKKLAVTAPLPSRARCTCEASARDAARVVLPLAVPRPHPKMVSF